jgi:hypothetical protein
LLVWLALSLWRWRQDVPPNCLWTITRYHIPGDSNDHSSAMRISYPKQLCNNYYHINIHVKYVGDLMSLHNSKESNILHHETVQCINVLNSSNFIYGMCYCNETEKAYLLTVSLTLSLTNLLRNHKLFITKPSDIMVPNGNSLHLYKLKKKNITVWIMTLGHAKIPVTTEDVIHSFL